MRASKNCGVCTGDLPPITYKNPEFLSQFLTERGMIKARNITKLCAKHQRQLKRNIKRARHLALLPFTTVSSKLSPKEIIEIFEADTSGGQAKPQEGSPSTKEEKGESQVKETREEANQEEKKEEGGSENGGSEEAKPEGGVKKAEAEEEKKRT